MKKSFITYIDGYETLQHLTDEQLGKLTRMTYEFVINGEIPNPTNALFFIFNPIRLQLERDFDKYETIKEKRSEAGKASANKRQQTSTLVNFVQQTSTNPTDNVTVNVNDNVTANETVNENETLKEKKREPKQSKIAKHIFADSVFHENETYFETEWMKTESFKNNPLLSIKKIFNTLRLSDEKYKYVNWIKAAENWVLRNPSQYHVSVKDLVQADPLAAFMNKGELISAEADLKRKIKRTLLNGNQPNTDDDERELPW
jgi:chromosome condensin MukBEF ATPase and DNA-binding subunit MukB